MMNDILFKRWLTALLVVAVVALSAIPLQRALAADTWYVRPGGHDTECNGTVDADYDSSIAPACAFATIQKGIDTAVAGDTVKVSGTFVLTGTVFLNKAITLDGQGSTLIQTSGTGYAFSISAAATLQGFEIEKTDDNVNQNIIYVGSDDVTIKGNVIHAQYVLGDLEVTRGLEVAGGISGLLIEGNTFYAIRQPAYINPNAQGTIKDNLVKGTRGWVIDGALMNFEGNTWGQGLEANYLDIALLPGAAGTPPEYYTFYDIVAVSEANNDAVIEDQRVSPAVLSVVYVDDDAAAGGNGGRRYPYQGILAAIDRVVKGGKIYVAAGTYSESKGGWRDYEIFKSLQLIGAGSSQTIVELTGKQNGVEIRPDTTVLQEDRDVLIQGIAFKKQASNSKSANFAIRISETGGAFDDITFRDVEVEYAQAQNIIFHGPTYGHILLEDCNVHHSGAWGLSFAGAASSITVKNCHFDNNGWADANHGIGFDIANPTSLGSLTVENSTFNNNTAKGVNLTNVSNATFKNIEAKNNSGATEFWGGYGVSLWEWKGGSSNLTFENVDLSGNSKDGILIGADTGMTIDDITITNAILQNNGRAGLMIWESAAGKITDIAIHNSVLTGNVQWAAFSNTTGQVNAENNYWGTISAGGYGTVVGIEDRVSGNIDWEPWQNATFTAAFDKPDTTYADLTNVGKAEEEEGASGGIFGYSAFATIQDAVNNVFGSTVYVAPGIYEEQVVIEQSLTLQGSGADPDEGTVIQAPDTLAQSHTVGVQTFYPVVLVKNAPEVHIKDLVVDGAGKGNGHNRFVGIGMFNSGGSVAGVEIVGIQETPFSGSQHGVGLYARNDLSGDPLPLEMTNTYIHDFQKNATVFRGNLDVNIHDNLIEGVGPTDIIAQNGLQLTYVQGKAEHNTVKDISYTGGYWTATGILLYGTGTSSLEIRENTVEDCQTGIYLVGGQAEITANHVEADLDGVGTDYYGILAANPPFLPPSPLDVEPEEQSPEVQALGMMGASSADVVVIAGNDVLGGEDSSDSVGIGAYAGYATDTDLNVTIENNHVSGWGTGVLVEQCEEDCTESEFTAVTVAENAIVGNEMGLWANRATLAERNWWGALSGPFHLTTNPDGEGDEVSDNVDYAPWLCDGTDAEPDTRGFQPVAGPETCTNAALHHLVFTQYPTVAFWNMPFAPQPQVRAEDADGNLVVTFNGFVYIALHDNPAGGLLTGTKVRLAENGVATFTDLAINKVGEGYSLMAYVLSPYFRITVGPNFNVLLPNPFYLPLIFR